MKQQCAQAPPRNLMNESRGASSCATQCGDRGDDRRKEEIPAEVEPTFYGALVYMGKGWWFKLQTQKLIKRLLAFFVL